MYASDPTYPAFPVFAFLGFVIVLIPLPWHLHSWNAGTCLYMIWTALACLNQFVNSIVWHGNAINWAPVWCDISSRIMVGSAVGIPLASLCINRRLYKIATVRSTGMSTRAEKRRMVMEDLAIGVGVPLIEIALHYIVEGHRFNIFEDIGCYPVTYNTWPAYPLVVFWPLVIGLISAIYCTLTLRAFLKRRNEFREFLSSSSALTINRYFRLMAVATTEICCTVPLSFYSIYLNFSSSTIEPWINWANVHFDWSFVGQYPSVIWRMSPGTVSSIEMSRWVLPVCAVVFFAFFGFAAEARSHYRALFWRIVNIIGIKPSQKPEKNSHPFPSPRYGPSGGSLPVFIVKSGYPTVSDATMSMDEEKGTPTTASSFESASPVTPYDRTLPPYSAAYPSPPHPSKSQDNDSALPRTSYAPTFTASEHEQYCELPLTPHSSRRRAADDDDSSFARSVRAHLDEIAERSSAAPSIRSYSPIGIALSRIPSPSSVV